MRLYTEEQVLKAAEFGYQVKSDKEILDLLTPIKLPSDEEIYDKAVFHDGSDYSLGQHNGFIDGAKWIIDKIKNKQQ